jgi:hypothetical protein
MQPIILISIVVVLLIVGILILAVRNRRTENGLDKVDREKYPRGYWMSVGISIGVAIGVAFGPIFDNIGVGIGIGIAIGTAIGASLEQKYKDSTRPLTELEQSRQKRAIVIGLSLAAALGVTLLIVFLLQAR